MKELARRDFLKLSGLGLAGIFAVPVIRTNPHFISPEPVEGLQGRVTATSIWTYGRPSFQGARIKQYWRDLLLPITNATISEDLEAYNRIWYEIGGMTYAYSGNLQPVRTILNEPRLSFAREGALAEVSVPFTDAHESPERSSKTAYRLYYQSTHWVMLAAKNPAGDEIWYQLWDDKLQKKYYALAQHLRILTQEELKPLSVEIPADRKRIEVRLSEQLVIAYEDELPVYFSRAATGAVYRVGTYTTPTGSFMTYHKRSTRHMAAGDLAASGFNLPGVPWVMYITEKGISLHGTYWHNDFGRPRSHGCINLSPQDAKWLFRWTTPVVQPDEVFAYKSTGTKVEIVA